MTAQPAGPRRRAPGAEGPGQKDRGIFVDRENWIYKLAPGKAKGRLVGGNISVFSTLVGTPFEPELKGRILFLEEVGEDPYRIDRWLTQFLLTGKLSGLAGVALGKFAHCAPGDYKPSYGARGSGRGRRSARTGSASSASPSSRTSSSDTCRTRRRSRSASWPSWTATRAR
jgi:hypothetical protein